MRCVFALTVAAGLCGVASNSDASIYQWDWVRGMSGDYGLNDTGGRFESVHATFDSTSKELLWSVTFSNTITQGFTLALNNGPNPKGHAGELALLYVDARAANNVRVTAYGYNGQNATNSWRDGNAAVSGDQKPDVIKNDAQRGTWLMDSGVVDVGGKRTISIRVDASDLVGHDPLYPDAVDPWKGIGFDTGLGLWMHAFRTFAPTYNNNGEISALQLGSEGWFDGKNFTTRTVPAPGAAALVGLAAVGGLRRRRR